jgi:hypothetical protein
VDKTLHSAAIQHLPAFVTAPGETDTLMVVTVFILLGAVIAFGVLFLKLHTLPERMAHKSHKLQFEIVAVLGLLALFTHMHIFWVAGLLLAMIDFPDIGGWLGRIAGSVERIADNGARDSPPDEVKPTADHLPHDGIAGIKRADGGALARPGLTSAGAGG